MSPVLVYEVLFIASDGAGQWPTDLVAFCWALPVEHQRVAVASRYQATNVALSDGSMTLAEGGGIA